MAHLRKRHAIDITKKILAFSPLVGIFGHRQVGKTTFIEHMAKSYVSFDDKPTRLAAEEDASLFLRGLGATPAGVDECQLVPDLFPALKELVRKNKAPGQILLSGSVKFYSRKAIRESLTGRIVNIDLLPLSLTELGEVERSRMPLVLIEKERFGNELEQNILVQNQKRGEKLINSYLTMGGLPGVCFIRDSSLRSARLKEQLQLMLDRDLRLVYPSSVPYLQILEFAHSLAQQEGEPYQPTITRKLTGLAEATQKKLLQALEAIFLIRLMSIEGDRRGLCVYFEDQAEHLFLAQERFDQLKAFEGLVYRNMRASFAYEAGYDYRVFQFRERPDVRIPYVFKSRNGSLGVLPILESSPSSKDLRMANRFLQKYNHSHILIVTLGQCQSKIIDSRILQIPAEKLLLE